MATRPIVPRATGEGSIGTSAKHWGNIYADNGNIAGRNIATDGVTLDNNSSAITALQGQVTTLEHAYAGAKAAATVADMTDHNQIYVYVGSETGYTNGNWYYWNGTAWTSGGVYNATALETDKTLTVSGAAADAKSAGDRISNLESVTGDIVQQYNRYILYSVGQYCIYNNVIYKCIKDKVNTGAWDSSYWKAVYLTDAVTSIDYDKIKKFPLKNLFDIDTFRYKEFWNETGTSIDYSAYAGTTGYIDVSNHVGEYISINKYTQTQSNKYHLFYDENGDVIQAYLANTSSFLIPANAKMCRMLVYVSGGNLDNLSDLQIIFGTNFGAYRGYNPIEGYINQVIGQYVAADNPLSYAPSAKIKGLSGADIDFDFESTTRLQDVYNWYDNLVDIFPQNITRVQIGTTTQPAGTWGNIDSNTYPIYAYVITGENADDNNNKIILAGGIHGDGRGGDGIQGVIAQCYFIKDMLMNPANKYLQYLKYNCTIVCIPVINPWGYQNGFRCNGRGVDLNRNFDYNWTSDTSYDYSPGTHAFSENETIAVKDFIENHHSTSKFANFIHTRGDDILQNDGRWMTLTAAPDTELYNVLTPPSEFMAEFYGGDYSQTVYQTDSLHGTEYSYFSLVDNIPSFEFEFFKSVNRAESTLNTADTEIQCVHFYAVCIQSLINHYLMS